MTLSYAFVQKFVSSFVCQRDLYQKLCVNSDTFLGWVGLQGIRSKFWCRCPGSFFFMGGSTLGRAALVPRFTCCPPDSKARWPFWRDFWGPKMLQNPNFPGLRSGPRWGSLQRSPRLPNWWGGGSLPLPRTPSRSWPFGPRFYGSQGLTQYRVGNPTNDKFQI